MCQRHSPVVGEFQWSLLQAQGDPCVDLHVVVCGMSCHVVCGMDGIHVRNGRHGHGHTKYIAVVCCFTYFYYCLLFYCAYFVDSGFWFCCSCRPSNWPGKKQNVLGRCLPRHKSYEAPIPAARSKPGQPTFIQQPLAQVPKLGTRSGCTSACR